MHGIHLAVREHEYLVSGIFTVFIFSRLHCMLPHTVSVSLCQCMHKCVNYFWCTTFPKLSGGLALSCDEYRYSYSLLAHKQVSTQI